MHFTDIIQKINNTEFWQNLWLEHYLKDKKVQRNKEATQAFWNRRAATYADKVKNEEGDTRLNRVLDFLHRHGVLKPGIKVLDVGSGPGVYSIPFAQQGAQVTALDMAQGGLDELTQRAKKLSLTMETMQADWEVLDLQASGLAGEFDLVFASLCPAIGTPDSVIKLMEASRGYVCHSGFVHSPEFYFQSELWETMTGVPYPQTSMRAAIMYTWLYSQGIYPATETIEVSFTRRTPLPEMVENTLEFYSMYKPLREEEKAYIRRFLEKKANTEDVVEQALHSVTGVTLWKGI